MENLEQQSTEQSEVGLTDQAEVATGGDSNEQVQEQLIEINGEQVPVSEVQAGYLRQSDYTRKTQELADMRRQQEELLRSVERASQIWNQNPVQNNFQQPQQEYVDPEVARVAQETIGLKQTVNTLNQTLGQMKAEMLMTQINNDPKYQGTFKDKDAEELLLAKHLQLRRGDDIKRTADEIYSFITKMKVKENKATEEKVVKNLTSPTRKAPTGATTSPKSTPKDFDPTKSGWRDLDKVAANML